MLERMRNVAFAVAMGGAVLASHEASPVLAGGCYKDSEVPYCSPIVVKVERPRFTIEALDFAHNGMADVYVGSKTRRFILFGDLTSDGADEAKLLVEEYCGPNGDNSLYTVVGPQSRTMVTSLDCIQRIQQTP